MGFDLWVPVFASVLTPLLAVVVTAMLTRGVTARGRFTKQLRDLSEVIGGFKDASGAAGLDAARRDIAARLTARMLVRGYPGRVAGGWAALILGFVTAVSGFLAPQASVVGVGVLYFVVGAAVVMWTAMRTSGYGERAYRALMLGRVSGALLIDTDRSPAWNVRLSRRLLMRTKRGSKTPKESAQSARAPRWTAQTS
jgi:hypothetical protein